MTDLKKKFEGFGKEPSPKTWEKISDGLDIRKKRKVGWWFFGGLVLLLSFGTLAYIGSGESQAEKKSQEIAQQYKEVSNEKNIDNKLLIDGDNKITIKENNDEKTIIASAVNSNVKQKIRLKTWS